MSSTPPLEERSFLFRSSGYDTLGTGDRPFFRFTAAPDEAVDWVLIPPNTLLARRTKLVSPNLAYALAVVPSDRPRDAALAVCSAKIGRVNPTTSIDAHEFPGLRPMTSYHVGYLEDDLWHWETAAIPLHLLPASGSPTGFILHLNHGQNPDVVGLRVHVASNSGFVSDRDYPLELMDIDVETEFQVVPQRNLRPGTAFTAQAWPLLRDGTVGSPSLPVKMCTLPAVALSVAEVGDTYLRLVFRRPPWSGPLNRGVEERDARIGRYRLEVWEDPRDSLHANAVRLSVGRQPQRYPLQRRVFEGSDVGVGVPVHIIVDRLSPDTAHFVVLHTATDTVGFAEPNRLHVCTTPETRLVQAAKFTARSVGLSWERLPHRALPRFGGNVSFPSQVNLFDDRDVSHPYVGSGVVPLPNGVSWGCVSSALFAPRAHYDVMIQNAEAGDMRILKTTETSIEIDELLPSSSYTVCIRTSLDASVAGPQSNPWSRPFLLTTPSATECRVVHRHHTGFRLAWGRRLATTIQPLPHPPGHPKYLPDADAPSESEHYYYLEPLPFIPVPEETEVSASEEEEDIYAEQDLYGVARGEKSYFGRRPRILNRRRRPAPLRGLAVQVVDPSKSVVLLVMKGDHQETSISRIAEANYLGVDLPREYCERYNVVANVTGAGDFGTAAIEGLLPGQAYTIYCFADGGLRRRFTTITLPSETIPCPQPHFDPGDQAMWRGLVLESIETTPTSSGAALHAGHPSSTMPSAAATALLSFASAASQVQTFSPSKGWIATGGTAGRALTTMTVYELSEVFVVLEVEREACQSGGVIGAVLRNPTEAAAASSQEGIPSACGVSRRRAPVGAAAGAARSSRFSSAPPHNTDHATMYGRMAEEEEGTAGEETAAVLLSDRGTKSPIANGLRWDGETTPSPAAGVAVDGGDERGDGGEEGGVVIEYMVQVTRTTASNDRFVAAEPPTHVYFSTSSTMMQVANLAAATRYELRLATYNNALCDWTAWSAPLTLTTVPKLEMVVDEISSEFLRLKWGRQVLDNITDYALTIRDRFPPPQVATTVATASGPRSQEDHGVEATPLSQPEYLDETLIVNGTSCRLNIMDRLRPNTVYDFSVVPRYTNGYSGLPSPPLRLAHCLLAARVVECGVDHLLVEWDPVTSSALLGNGRGGAASATPSATAAGSTTTTTTTTGPAGTGWFIVRIRQGDTWERTIQLPGDARDCLVSKLSLLTEYTINVSYVLLFPRGSSDAALVDPRKVLGCTDAFALKATTLTQPTARVHRLGEACVELQWRYYTEAEHAGSITMEVRFVDQRKAESFQVFANCETVLGETVGEGAATIEGLLPERLYAVDMRQQYNRGTWGNWQRVLDGVSTLRRIQVAAANIGETFFTLAASRPSWTAVEGTHESMAQAEQINPALWRFSVTHGGTGVVSTVESTTPQLVFGGLEASTPYAISVQQYSIKEWGEPSATLYLYSLAPMLPVVVLRADNYLDIGCQRDRRPPTTQSPHCRAHDEAAAAVLSALERVVLTATSLLDSSKPPVVVVLEGDEATVSVKAVGHIVGLLPAHPYLIRLASYYRGGAAATEASLATITLPVPELVVVDTGEDTLMVARQASKQSITHYSTFAVLPPHVRAAARDGGTATVAKWQVRAVAADVADAAAEREAMLAAEAAESNPSANQPQTGSTADGTSKAATGTTPSMADGGGLSASSPSPKAFTGTPAPNALKVSRAFQDACANEVIVEVGEGTPLCTVGGLMPETEYVLSLRSIDKNGNAGWFLECCRVRTANFAALNVIKLAENFVELSWSTALVPSFSTASPRRSGAGGAGGHGGVSRALQRGGGKGGNGRGLDGSPRHSRPVSPLSARTGGESGKKATATAAPGQLASPVSAAPNLLSPGVWNDLLLSPQSTTPVDTPPADMFELVVLDAANPDFDNAPTTRVEFSAGTALITNLKPRTQYLVMGRTHRVVKGQVIKGTWGPQVRFATLALLVLRVVHISLDFANVSWHQEVIARLERGVSLMNRSAAGRAGIHPDATAGGVSEGNASGTNGAEGAEGSNGSAPAANRTAFHVDFPAQLRGSSCFFCSVTNSGSLGTSAAAVRFQLRVMDVTADGAIGGLKQDMFVTDSADGLHCINDLCPAKSYAISMRVCYEGVSGSWVEPAIITTDHVPEAKVVAITQNSAEFLFQIQYAPGTQQVVADPVPARRHRLYEILIVEKASNQLVMVDGNQRTALRLAHLKRDSFYRVDLREIIRGQRYGGFTHLTSFWTQPYPPIITELVECRDNICEIHWGVMNNERVGEVLQMDRVPPGFVYSFERGVRHGIDSYGGWEEIAVTDVPWIRFQWRDSAHHGSASEHHGHQDSSSSGFSSPARSGGSKPGKDSHLVVPKGSAAAAGGSAAANSAAAASGGAGASFSSFGRQCFRVRLSKLFVSEPGKSFKVPVWGDYSEPATWPEPSPPSAVQKIRLAHMSDTFVIVAWSYPEEYKWHPQLRFTVEIDASRAYPGAEQQLARPEWYTVGTTRELHMRVDRLVGNTPYRVLVRGSSTFGVGPTTAAIAFTTRAVPNLSPPLVFPPRPSDAALGVHGRPPVPPRADPSNNLHDKYEEPKRLRLKALTALAGIQNKPRRPKLLLEKLQRAVAKINVIMTTLREASYSRMMDPEFDPNTELTPWQRVRRDFKMTPYGQELRWSNRRFHLKAPDQDTATIASTGADLFIANTIGRMIVETPTTSGTFVRTPTATKEGSQPQFPRNSSVPGGLRAQDSVGGAGASVVLHASLPLTLSAPAAGGVVAAKVTHAASASPLRVRAATVGARSSPTQDSASPLPKPRLPLKTRPSVAATAKSAEIPPLSGIGGPGLSVALAQRRGTAAPPAGGDASDVSWKAERNPGQVVTADDAPGAAGDGGEHLPSLPSSSAAAGGGAAGAIEMDSMASQQPRGRLLLGPITAGDGTAPRTALARSTTIGDASSLVEGIERDRVVGGPRRRSHTGGFNHPRGGSVDAGAKANTVSDVARAADDRTAVTPGPNGGREARVGRLRAVTTCSTPVLRPEALDFGARAMAGDNNHSSPPASAAAAPLPQLGFSQTPSVGTAAATVTAVPLSNAASGSMAVARQPSTGGGLQDFGPTLFSMSGLEMSLKAKSGDFVTGSPTHSTRAPLRATSGVAATSAGNPLTVAATSTPFSSVSAARSRMVVDPLPVVPPHLLPPPRLEESPLVFALPGATGGGVLASGGGATPTTPVSVSSETGSSRARLRPEVMSGGAGTVASGRQRSSIGGQSR